MDITKNIDDIALMEFMLSMYLDFLLVETEETSQPLCQKGQLTRL